MSISKGLPFAYVVVALAFIAYVHAGGSNVGVDRNLPGRWCIASPLANDGKLQNDMNSLCGRAVDCSSIRPGGACFNPNTVKDHASVVFNNFYKAHGSQSSACNFGGDAMLSLANPCKP
ncbi:glucan endo-1,3-beta-D-glucosidase-like [Typha latifolia]|uniref:glucan endo-1,3-beta-D-glucosidase-like n=1 Tax=Typha latifolia TaxID=4733 RepID=UPI003C2C8009